MSFRANFVGIFIVILGVVNTPGTIACGVIVLRGALVYCTLKAGQGAGWYPAGGLTYDMPLLCHATPRCAPLRPATPLTTSLLVTLATFVARCIRPDALSR